MPQQRRVIAEIDWKGYEGDTVLLPVCVRSPAMQGRNLIATMKALSTRIHAVELILIDTLDRYNFNRDASICRLRGKNWMNTSLPQIREHLDIRSVIYWDEVIGDPSYQCRLNLINSMHDNDPFVRQMIEVNAKYFVDARKERNPSLDADREMENSINYMIEEYAGTAVYADWFKGLPEAYWGIYVGDPGFFQKRNPNRFVGLKLPEVLPITINRLPLPFAGEQAVAA